MSRYRVHAVALIVIFTFFAVSDTKPTEEKDKIWLRHSDKVSFQVIPQAERIELRTSGGKFMPYKLTYEDMELTYLGRYYITAYSPSECGYNGENFPCGWTTASGEICHRADYEHRLSEPTTAAISRSVHSFGDEFYLPDFDRTFVAEDTGSGVRGYHLDLFYEDYEGEESVMSFPTGYFDVYAVEWVEVTVIVTEEDHEHLKTTPPLEYYRDKENDNV